MQPTSQTRDCFIEAGFDPFAGSAYLFDIDGTLLHTRDGVHWNAFRRALREVFGIESLLDTIPVHGNTDIGILRAVAEQHQVPRENFERELPRVLELMGADVERNCDGLRCELCPAVRELLEELRERGKLLGVVSGNLESIGWRKVDAAGLRDFFAFGSFSDHAEQRVGIFRQGLARAQAMFARASGQSTGQPPLAADHCFFVGDTPADVRAAQALGAPVIAVASGIYDFAELLASSPPVCVLSCRELLRLR